MADQLADEVLNMIFRRCLAVPDSAFASTETRSPFSRMEQSSSTLLVVCKRWMRVATPLLYETVILRSTAQAQALAAALKANQDFGRHIKKLRVEGGYGVAVEKVINAAPNITDFCMTLKLWATDNVKGMCKAMPSMNPRRLVITALNTMARNNVNTRAALDALCTGIETWTNLATVVLPGSVTMSEAADAAVIDALKTCPTLKRVELTGEFYQPYGVLNDLASNASVETIHVAWSEGKMSHDTAWHLLGLLGKNVKLSAEADAKVRYAPESDKPILAVRFRSPVELLPLDPSYKPMASATEAERAKIWGLVLKHVIKLKDTSIHAALAAQLLDDDDFDMWVHEDTDDDFGLDLDEEDDWDSGYAHRGRYGRAVKCMLVSKEFRAVATKVACEELMLRSSAVVTSFLSLLRRQPSVADDVRSVHFTMAMRGETPMPGLDALLSRLTRLKKVSMGRSLWTPSHLPYSSLSTLAEASGSTITSLENLTVTGSGSIDVLARFSALTHLDWDGQVKFNTKTSSEGLCLPALTHLTLRNYESSFLAALAPFDLPMLSTLELLSATHLKYMGSKERAALGSFLDLHGDKIRTFVQDGEATNLVLSKCPNIEDFKFAPRSDRAPSHEVLALESPHRSLERIRMPYMVQKSEEQWFSFLESLTNERLPALRTIDVPNRNFWPTTQREIAKSSWPPIAEKLLEFGIKIVDGEGVAWRPRLQTSTRRK